MTEPTTEPQSTPPVAPQGEPDEARLAASDLLAILKDVRRREAGVRSRMTALENEKKSMEDELGAFRSEKQKREEDFARKNGEFEKLDAEKQKRNDDLEVALKQKDVEFATYRKVDAVRAQAMKLGIVDPTIVAKLVDVSNLPDDPLLIETAATEAAAKMKNDMGYLFKPQAAPAPQVAQVPFPGFPVPPPLPAPQNLGEMPDARQMSEAEFAATEARLTGRSYSF